MPMDVTRVSQTLIGLGQNPNLASVLLVSLGCESVVLDEVAEAIAAVGKRVERLVIQEEGGAARSVAKGELLAQDLVLEASALPTELCPVSDLVLGLKCGSSDTTQGLFATPAVGITKRRPATSTNTPRKVASDKGTSMRNVAPVPGVEVTVIVPPSFSTFSRTIARPSPLPERSVMIGLVDIPE